MFRLTLNDIIFSFCSTFDTSFFFQYRLLYAFKYFFSGDVILFHDEGYTVKGCIFLIGIMMYTYGMIGQHSIHCMLAELRAKPNKITNKNVKYRIRKKGL
jgi:hypothetical protein